MLLQMYKKKQGQIVRWTSFGVAILLFLYGGFNLFSFLGRWEWATDNVWLQFIIPLVDINVVANPRLLIAVTFVIGSAWLFYFLALQQHRISEFLIDTESEMRKVSWPTMTQVAKSSTAVILIVFILGLYLYLIDGVFANIFRFIFRI